MGLLAWYIINCRFESGNAKHSKANEDNNNETNFLKKVVDAISNKCYID